MQGEERKKLKVCMAGSGIFRLPLDRTSEKKYQALSALANIFVIGYSKDVLPRRFVQYARFLLAPRIPLPKLKYLALITMAPALMFWSIFRHGIRIFICQDIFLGCGAVLVKAIARTLGIKTVVIIENHGDFEKGPFLQHKMAVPWLYKVAINSAALFSLKNADILRAVSKATRLQLERFAPGKPVFQFMAWTDIEVFLPQAGPSSNRSKPSIVYAGVITPLKGIHVLIEAFTALAAEFPDLELVLAGDCINKEYNERLNSQIRASGLDEKVNFIGSVPQQELARLMHNAVAFVLPSFSEGLPRVVVEAMACGTLVVASRVGAIPDVIEDNITGFLVPAGNANVLADKLKWVLLHPKEAGEMGGKASAFAKQFFSTEAYVDGYRKIFDTAVEVLRR